MGDFIKNFEDDLNRDQVRYLIDKLVDKILIQEGSGSGTYYTLVEGVKDIDDLIPILGYV